MAKKQRNQIVSAAFHYLVKEWPAEQEGDPPMEGGFDAFEFEHLCAVLADTRPIDDADAAVVRAIKQGVEMHRHSHLELSPGVYFGEYEGAYYGQRIRSNVLGEIDPESLLLRRFYYLITRMRDGKILVGVTYHGQFGDYDGIRSFLSHHLRGNHRVASKTLKSIETEIGEGTPISIKLTYRKAADRAERRPLWGASGEIAVKRADFGEDFEERFAGASRRIQGTEAQRKRAIAELVRQGDILELDDDEILGCSAVIRENGRHRTVYFLGENNFATKFYLPVEIGMHGEVDPNHVAESMLRIMRERVFPLIDDAAVD